MGRCESVVCLVCVCRSHTCSVRHKLPSSCCVGGGAQCVRSTQCVLCTPNVSCRWVRGAPCSELNPCSFPFPPAVPVCVCVCPRILSDQGGADGGVFPGCPSGLCGRHARQHRVHPSVHHHGRIHRLRVQCRGVCVGALLCWPVCAGAIIPCWP